MTIVDRRSGLSAAVAIKGPVRLATTANITLSGYQTIDGVLPTTSEHPRYRRILVKNQDDAAENGIYDMSVGPWQRSADFNSIHDFGQATRVVVWGGDSQAGTYEVASAVNPLTFEVDADDIDFEISMADLEWVTVSMFGTSCDGTTDNTAAFALAKATGKPIYIPAGDTVLIDAATWSTGAETLIFGDGNTSVIKWRNTTGSESLFKFTTTQMAVTFRDLTINCNNSVHTDTSSYFAAIDFWAPSGSGLRLQRVNFTNGRIVDVRAVGPTTAGQNVALNIEYCTFSGGIVGTALRSAQCVNVLDAVRVRLHNNSFSQSSKPSTYGRAGFVFDSALRNGTDERGMLVASGNRFQNIGRGTADTLGCIDVYYGADDVSITGNNAKQVVGRFITVKGDQTRMTIVGNVAEDIYSSVANVATGIVMFQDLYGSTAGQHLVIADNVIGTSDGYGIFVDGASISDATNFSNILLANNALGVCGIAGIHVRNTGGVSIVNPMIDGGPAAIDFTAITGSLRIFGGALRNQTNDAISGHEGIAANTACDFSIQGTLIENCTDRAITITAVKSYDINADIDGAAIAWGTAGSTEHSRIRGRVRNATSLWSKSSTDTLTDYAAETTSALGFTVRELTIASGAVTAFADWHFVDTEADAAADDLDTINGGWEGRKLVLFSSTGARDVTLRDGAGNIQTPDGGNITLGTTDQPVHLLYRGTNWYVLNRPDIVSATMTFTGKTINLASNTVTGTLAEFNTAVSDATLLASDVEDQAVTGGARVTSKDLGTITSGTVTPDPGDRPLQNYTNSGAHTLAPSTATGSLILDISNGSSAGTITASTAWTKVIGDAFTTSTGHTFRCSLSIGSIGSLLSVTAVSTA